MATILLITGNYREQISRVVVSETNTKAKNVEMARCRIGEHTGGSAAGSFVVWPLFLT